MSKTIILAIVNLVVAALVLIGVNVSPEMQQTLVDNASTILVAWGGINGVLQWILRAVTESPLAAWWGKKSAGLK